MGTNGRRFGEEKEVKWDTHVGLKEILGKRGSDSDLGRENRLPVPTHPS